MKKKKNKLIWVILTLILVFVVMLYFYMKPSNDSNATSSDSTIKEIQASEQTITKSISSSGEISSAKTETLELNTSRYFKEIYVEKNDSIKLGENILQYTNGTYLTAPYDCIISEISVPETGKICTDTSCIKIQSTEELYVTLNINEEDIDTVKVGQEAEITVSAYGNKKYTGIIEKISDIGSYSSNGSTFTATVKFANDGTVKIGMSGSCVVILEKAENVVAVPKEAVQTMGNMKYVIVVESDGTTRNAQVETGISNDAYTEIKSGLTGTEIVQMIESTSSSNSNSNFRQITSNPSGGQFVMPSGGMRGGQ